MKTKNLLSQFHVKEQLIADILEIKKTDKRHPQELTAYPVMTDCSLFEILAIQFQ